MSGTEDVFDEIDLRFSPFDDEKVGIDEVSGRADVHYGRYAVNKTVMRIAPYRLEPGGIPDALEEILLPVKPAEGSEAFALVCRGRICLPPVHDPEALLEAMEHAG